MDIRSRGTFLTSAGFIIASVGFTLSVLSTLLRMLLFFHRPVLDAQSHPYPIRKPSARRKHPATDSRSTPKDLETTLSGASNGSSSESGSSTTPDDQSGQGKDECQRTTSKAARRTGRRRSDSTPTSPAPWASTHDSSAPVTRRKSVDRSAAGTARMSDSGAGAEKKVRRSPSMPGAGPKEHAEGRRSTPPARSKSQVFAPFLPRRRSHIAMDTAASEHEPSARTSNESSSDSSPPRPALVPKRSQTLRTQPYQAPYFFPMPGSAEARPLPRRRRTMPVNDLSAEGADAVPPVPPLPAAYLSVPGTAS
ncbi:unnamed protein product [Mycena citricolor]|uniref:Uncharacterized protein n=1 Tax=Mycena citricolor TaxID=2018698 RepID=A0AAD2HQS8_9AGAR|nr:unnamed protein product [Mycena citricolor]